MFSDKSKLAKFYWTGGTRKGCLGQYSWCLSNQTSWTKNDDSSFKLLETGKGSCVVVSTKGVSDYNYRIYTSYNYLLGNLACEKQAILACEGQKVLFDRNNSKTAETYNSIKNKCDFLPNCTRNVSAY